MLNSAVILAGGKSSRMGRDKALLPFGKFNSLAEFQYNKLNKIFKNVYISSKENKFNFNAKIIKDSAKEFSPLIAIDSILNELGDDFFLISVDLPLISIDTINNLLTLYKKNPTKDIYLYKNKNCYEPMCAIYTVRVKKNITNLLKRNIHKLQLLVKNSNIATLTPKNEDEFKNLNYYKDYKEALELLK